MGVTRVTCNFPPKPIHWPDELYFVEELNRNLTLWLVYDGSMSLRHAQEINRIAVFAPAEFDVSPQIINTWRSRNHLRQYMIVHVYPWCPLSMAVYFCSNAVKQISSKFHQPHARLECFAEEDSLCFPLPAAGKILQAPKACLPWINIWLVLWNIFYFPIQLGMSSSQLTFIFFRGVAQPPTSDLFWVFP